MEAGFKDNELFLSFLCEKANAVRSIGVKKAVNNCVRPCTERSSENM